MTPEQLRSLRSVPVRVHTHLHEGLGNRAFAVRNERTFQSPLEIGRRGGVEPRGFLRLSTGVSLNQRVEGESGAGFVLENKRQPSNGEQPESIRQQNVVKEFPQLRIGCRGRVLSNGIQQGSVRVSFVIDQISQHLEHRARS